MSSNGQCNGDWLAKTRAGETLDGKGNLMVDVLIAIFENNGVDMTAKLALARYTNTLGWQGRFRMSGRVVL